MNRAKSGAPSGPKRARKRAANEPPPTSCSGDGFIYKRRESPKVPGCSNAF